jgi:hypothetical protein
VFSRRPLRWPMQSTNHFSTRKGDDGDLCIDESLDPGVGRIEFRELARALNRISA